jgi:hypothetical protein
MPDDGLPIDEVGVWALEKHERLRKYISAARGARRKYLPPSGTGGATYVDLYCGSGKAIIRDTGQEKMEVLLSPLNAHGTEMRGFQKYTSAMWTQKSSPWPFSG